MTSRLLEIQTRIYNLLSSWLPEGGNSDAEPSAPAQTILENQNRIYDLLAARFAQMPDEIVDAVLQYLEDHPEAINQAAVEAILDGRLDDIEEDVGGLKSAIEGLEAGSLSALGATAGQVPTAGGDGSWEWATPSGGGGGETASILIAASNSAPDLKERADYVCTGTNDQITINNAMNGMTGGEICLLAGDYYISGEINPVSNVDIKGLGNPYLHLTNRVITTLAQAASVNDKTIYLTDPSGFVVGQKIGIKWGDNANNVDWIPGHIKTIDYETGAVTMYSRAIENASQDIKTRDGFVNHAADAGAQVLTDSCVFMGWAVDNITISGLIIDGNMSNLSGYTSDTDFGANCIEFYGGTNIRILNNKLTNCYKHSVLFVYGTSNSFVCENVIDTALTHGIDFYTNVENNLVFGNVLNSANIQCHGGLKTIIANNLLTGCAIHNTGGTYNLIIGNRIDNTNKSGRCMSITGSGAKYTLIEGNIFIGGSQGVQLDSSTDFKMSGNKFINQGTWAIDLYAAKDCCIDNNDIYTPNVSSSGNAIVIENAATKNIITGNTIHGTSGNTAVGINEIGNSADYNVIANNVVFGAATGVAKVGTNSVEQNNIIV